MRIALSIAAISVCACAAAETTPASRQDPQVVRACLTGSGQINFIVGQAEKIANEIFVGAGVQVVWRFQPSRCKPVDAGEMHIEVTADTPGTRYPKALGYTLLTGDPHTEIFYDRIVRAVDPIDVPKLLGHVLAHEITHVLEGVARHSSTGLMKESWNERDFRDLKWKPLPLAPEDLELLARGLQMRQERLAKNETALARAAGMRRSPRRLNGIR